MRLYSKPKHGRSYRHKFAAWTGIRMCSLEKCSRIRPIGRRAGEALPDLERDSCRQLF